jgi:hypothetical protein
VTSAERRQGLLPIPYQPLLTPRAEVSVDLSEVSQRSFEPRLSVTSREPPSWTSNGAGRGQ